MRLPRRCTGRDMAGMIPLYVHQREITKHLEHVCSKLLNEGQLLHINVHWFRGGLVFKADRHCITHL